MLRGQKQTGFTIVELLIVIVVIGILAAISLVAYTNVQDRARKSQASSDLALLEKAIQAARVNTGQTINSLTGSGHSGGACFTAENTYPGSLVQSHACWVQYYSILGTIGTAAKMNLDGLRKGDPWGAPYYIDENEGENYNSQGLCRSDVVGSFTNPLPATRDGYDLANGGSSGYNWLRQSRVIRAGVNTC